MRTALAGVATMAAKMAADKALGYSTQPEPTGLARLFDLTFLSDPSINHWSVVFFCLALPFYIAGIGLPVVIGWMLWVQVGMASFCNSQGFIGHTTQVVSLVLLAQWLASLWTLLPGRDGWRGLVTSSTRAMNLSMDWSRQTLAACYVVSAICKVVASGGLWIWKAPLFALQITKANQMQFYSTLEPSPGNMAWLSQLLLDHPALARIIIGSALPLELFAFLMCFNRGVGAIYALLLVIFHSTVSEVMSLGFVFNKFLLLILCVNVPYWLWRWSQRCGDDLT